MTAFKGWDWTELAIKWGITVEEQPFNVLVGEDNEYRELFKRPERIDVKYYINGTHMVFTTEDEEEVLAEKLRRYVWGNLDMSKGEFKNKQMRVDMNNFLLALIGDTDEEYGDYSNPVYRAIIEIESDYTFASWFLKNLDQMWN